MTRFNGYAFSAGRFGGEHDGTGGTDAAARSLNGGFGVTPRERYRSGKWIGNVDVSADVVRVAGGFIYNWTSDGDPAPAVLRVNARNVTLRDRGQIGSPDVPGTVGSDIEIASEAILLDGTGGRR